MTRTPIAATLESLVRAMLHPSFELTCDEAAGVVSTVAAAQRQGVRFEPLTLALVGVLRRQLADATGDRDDADLCEGEGQTFPEPTAVFRREVA